MTGKLLHLDIESTGTDTERHGIHQIAGIIEINGVEKERFDIKVKPHPRAQINIESLEYCRVSFDQIMAYQPAYNGWLQLQGILRKYVDIGWPQDRFRIVGYNTQGFDMPILKTWIYQCALRNDYNLFFRSVTLDVAVLAADYLEDNGIRLPSDSLPMVASHFGIKPEGKYHDATFDVHVSHLLYHKLNDLWQHQQKGLIQE